MPETGSAIIIAILEMRKQSHREVKQVLKLKGLVTCEAGTKNPGGFA